MVTNIIGASNNTGLTASAARYLYLYGFGGVWSTASAAAFGQSVMSVGGTLQNLYVSIATASGAGLTRTFTIYKNGSTTGVTVTLSGAGSGAGITTGNDLVNTVSFSAGDTISIQTTASGTTANTGMIKWSIGASCAANVSMLLSNSGSGNFSVMPIQSAPGASASASVEQTMPTGGTIQNAYVQLQAAQGAGSTLTATLYQNGNPTSLSVVISGASATSGNDTNAGHAVTVVAGDRLYWNVPASNAFVAAIGIEFDPTADGESVHLYTGTANQTTGSATSQTLGLSLSTFSATESLRSTLTQAVTWKKLYIYEQSALSGAGTYKYQPQYNASTGNLTVTMSSSSQSGNDTTHTDSTNGGDTVSMKITPASTPTAVPPEWGIVSYITPLATSTNSNFLLFM